MLTEGMKVPVRYSVEDPSHAAVDEPGLKRRTIEHHRRNQEEMRRQAEEELRRSD
jgi:hypothetical protein